ncbi:DUF5805 domain-containing protein [Halovenus halobia]|uniref:DUF5805 domain-containing protein n=1 Tax=Halovenus halobia TaxID=3396622 RepID=UPI003F54A083
MGAESDQDTSRAVVQTYVPTYQRELWDDHADRLDMSRSEFVRTMVQAGRRQIGDDPELANATATETDSSEDESLGDEVLALLDEDEALAWEEMLSALTDDIESRLDDTLQELQGSNQIRYSGREDGYVLVEDA